ncbi:hypothetical protein P3X46_026703 [Hevea brasiliensis]|uniref:Bromo domain-containing protein n=1 Tax=Hevea brasiliensis TaxID=3981 RepID=A0ABQ9KYZ5_HEVBR|nr:transcription factor GTE12 [Hevea brasiliensis]XP_057991840.1 transcription factor GTE12 [Hevea brasiliensis]KAJ9153239.1 hypothetical protein P3X46_026703 [Hevea brasiliensis]
MIAAETVIAKKLKIKFSTQRTEAVSGIKTCESGRNADKNYGSRACDTQSTRLKPVVPGANKRGPSCMVEGQPEKKRKMDRSVTHQCFSLLKSLINNPSGWAFREPVDPVALNIPDYFSIISNPMDLGTIKSKLEKNQYSGAEEFAADVRLTFSNAMLYNPPTNYVHQMAESMNKIFETKWKSLEGKWKCQRSKSGDGKILSGKPKEISGTRQNCPETPPLRNSGLPKKSKLSENETMRSSLNARAAEVKLSKPMEIHRALHQNSYKGTSSGRNVCCSISVKPSLSPVVNECGASGRSASQCCFPSDSTHASSDISSERSSGRDDNACGTDVAKLGIKRESMSTSQMSKSDPDSDGAVSALDDENACLSSQRMTSATDVTSGEGLGPPIYDVQLSPTKALRAAIVRHRFAETILKAQHKTLLDHGDKGDPVKMQQEKERLERRQREEKAWIEAQIRAAEAASRMREEIELKKQREKEREAARIALQKMEKTADIEQNLEILKELEKLSGGSLSYHFRIGSKRVTNGEMEAAYTGSPLERLGLFIKDDIWDEDEMVVNGDEEEGEIFP